MLAKLFILLSLVHTEDGDIMRKTKIFNSEAECQTAMKAESDFLKTINIPTGAAMLVCIGTPWNLPGVNI